jgi:Subtilase family
MALFIKVALYLVIGLILAIVDLLFIRRMAAEFRPKVLPPVIAPFRIVGKAAEADKIGEVLAQMGVARANELKFEINSAFAAVTAPGSKTPPVDGATPLQLQTYDAHSEPLQVARLATAAPDVKVSLAGVEVSGFLAWMQRAVDGDRTINVSVNYSGAGANSRAVMSPRGDSSERWIEMDSKDDGELLENVAYALEKRRRGSSDRLIAAMPLSTFRQYIDAVKDAATLNRTKEKTTEAQYEPLRVKITAVIDSMPAAKWAGVYDFAAQIAERANHAEQAAQFYERQLADGDVPATQRGAMQTKIVELRKKNDVVRAATAAAQHSTAPTAPLGDVLSLLGVTPGPMTHKVRIAIIGPDPAQAAKNDPMRDYIAGVTSMVKAIAPDAEIIFPWSATSASPAVASGELLASIDEAIQQGAQVVLCPWGPFGNKPADQAAVRALVSRNIKFIVPSGNLGGVDSQPFFGSPLAAQVAIAAAADRNAKPALFSNRGPDVLWAIGVDVPIKKPDGSLKLNSGTSIASAIVAGMMARLVGEHPDLDAVHANDILRSTSRSRGTDTVPLLNLDAALAKAKQN